MRSRPSITAAASTPSCWRAKNDVLAPKMRDLKRAIAKKQAKAG